MNSLLKLLCSIMNDRICKHIEENNLIKVEQIGFQKKNRTTDHILTLKAIINKYVYDSKKKVYACFVDFKKAFDSVNHKALFHKLERNNINGNFLNLLKNIYKHSNCAVKLNNKLTQFFNYERGVIQGNPLSPTLFNIYVNDLITKIEETNNDPVTLDGIKPISTLMYADDLIIMSTSKTGLQNSLNALYSYTINWNLEINYKKTKCMTFSKGNQKEKYEFTLNNQKIECNNEFKYLGITINKKGNFTPTLNDLSCRANKAIYTINSKMNIKFLSPKILLKLFDSMISPILLYGCELWEPYLNQDIDKWDANPIEKVHTQFIKRILGVNRSTTNILVRGDLGRHSLQSKCIIKNIRYIKYIKQKEQRYTVKQAYDYEMSQSEKRITINSSGKKFNENLNNLLEREINIYTIPENKLRSYIDTVFHNNWNEKINNSTKADTYKQFKTKPKFEGYLDYLKNIKHVKILNKFRLSDHKLMIEEGRKIRPRIPRNERLCKDCNKLEDEIHFLIDCKKYENERELMFNNISTIFPIFQTIIDSRIKFIFLMSQENEYITKIIASNIHKWFEIRETSN